MAPWLDYSNTKVPDVAKTLDTVNVLSLNTVIYSLLFSKQFWWC